MSATAAPAPYSIGTLIQQFVPGLQFPDLRFLNPSGIDAARSAPGSPDSPSGVFRMHASTIGNKAATLIGNEDRTLAAIRWLAAELVLEMTLILRKDEGLLSRGGRALISAANPQRRSQTTTVILLDPDLEFERSRRITQELHFTPELLRRVVARINLPSSHLDAVRVAGLALAEGEGALAEVLNIARPEIIVSQAPKMEQLSAPWPNVGVSCGGKSSTIGIYCTDRVGVAGVTACYHATGGVGTSVTIAGSTASVGAASIIQDIVFIPFGKPPGTKTRGVAGVLSSKTPTQYQDVTFYGATSGEVKTLIDSWDGGLLRRSPTLQLKVQTRPAANFGDSGAALVDEDDDVLIGFALETSGATSKVQLTDWVWADNALAALDLTPA